jgi:toxin ParE1/3/4
LIDELRVTRRAAENLTEIADYLHQHNPPAARRVRSAIVMALENLLLFPHAGRRQTVEGIRKFVTPRYVYLIYYLVDDPADELVVLSVKHPARERDFEDA